MVWSCLIDETQVDGRQCRLSSGSASMKASPSISWGLVSLYVTRRWDVTRCGWNSVKVLRVGRNRIRCVEKEFVARFFSWQGCMPHAENSDEELFLAVSDIFF